MKNKENYLEKVPVRHENINWSIDENNLVTLDIENKGVANKIAQLLLKKPKISHILLDEFGSYIWQMIDGKISIIEIGVEVEKCFGDKAHPLYERLAKYFQILENYKFIKWIDKEK